MSGAPEKAPADRLAIEYRPLAELIPYAKNARTHSVEQLAQIRASMLEFGWTNPVLLDGADLILAGHGRVVEASRIWSEGKHIARCPDGLVPCVDLHGLSEAQKRAYFDNTHDSMTDVWHSARVLGEERLGHATPKPVMLTARAIESSCPPGGLVLEPFAGSGTTVIAAESTGRVCYAMEVAPEYVDVTVMRWQLYAGAAATLEGDGRTFEAVRRERVGASGAAAPAAHSGTPAAGTPAGPA